MRSVTMGRREAARIIAQAVIDGRVDRECQIVLAPWCDQPVLVWIRGLPSAALDAPTRMPLLRVAAVACRKCDGCLKHRTNLWAARAFDECAQSNRDWFGTLTFRPELQFRALSMGRATARKRLATEFEKLPAAEQFGLVAQVQRAAVQRYFKRLRKAGNVFRYLAVVEEHTCKCDLCEQARLAGVIDQKSNLKDHWGFPHFHCLLHEISEPVVKSDLDGQWAENGFSQWRLIGTDAERVQRVFYAAKYATKTRAGRVAASVRYGAPRSGARLAGLDRAAPEGIGKEVCQKGKEEEALDDVNLRERLDVRWELPLQPILRDTKL